jgi:hypothetical protein
MTNSNSHERRLHALWRLGDGEARGNLDAHHEVMHPGFRDFRFGASEPVIGVDEYVKSFLEFRGAMNELSVEVPIPPIVDGLHVTTVWTYRGRMSGPLWGLPPSDSEFTWRGCSVWTFDDDDRIVELRTFGDVGQLLQQITSR